MFLAASFAASESRPSQYDVEAAYLLNFGRFLRLTPEAEPRPGATFDICVLGEDLMGRSLDAIAENEKIDGRPVRIRRVPEARQARSCDIVYISAAEGERIGTDLEALRGASALTVSDDPGFLRQGGIIQFVLQGSHVRFGVNLDAARKSRVNLSSQLLRVAFSIGGAPSGEVTP